MTTCLFKKPIAHDGGIRILSNNSEVPISQRKKAQILELIRKLK